MSNIKMAHQKRSVVSPLFNFFKGIPLDSFLFLLIFFLELSQILYLAFEHRFVFHDTLFYLLSQYYFLNNAVNYGEIPHWIPYLTHGVTATYWYGVYGLSSIFLNVLLHTGSLLKDINFLPIFYAGIFFNKLILLTGVWLLTKRYFSSPVARFFVTVSIMGSSLWMTQIYFNFLIYATTPLILYLFHTFLDTQKWRYGFFALNLLALQCLDKSIYFIPVVSLTIFLYFFCYFIFHSKEVWQQLKTLRWGWPSAACIAGVGITFLAIYALLHTGVNNQIVQQVGTREASMAVPLDLFLRYGAATSLFKWLELILGFSPAKDYTLYIGSLSLLLLLLGLLCNFKKHNRSLVSLIIILVLFSSGTFVARFFYSAWPLMKFYRHIALISPIIRVFLCFLIGFGVEAMLTRPPDQGSLRLRKYSILFVSSVGMALFVFLWITAHDIKSAIALKNLVVHSLATEKPIGLSLSKMQDILPNLFRLSAINFFIASLVLFFLRFTQRKNLKYLIISFALIFHVFDMYRYSFCEAKKRTVPLNPGQYQVMQFQPLPYKTSRNADSWKGDGREQVFSPPIKKHSTLYWVTDAFLFNDPVSSSLTTHFWQQPFDQFLRAYSGQSIDNPSEPPAFLDGKTIRFPLGHPGARKFAGVDEDKIQFFSKAFFVPDLARVASYITQSQYSGDMLFISHPNPSAQNTPHLSPSLDQEDLLSENHRLSLPYTVHRFESNHLEVSIHNPEEEPVWMFYSDVWHPQWQATINGRLSQVFKANLAYKAVSLQPGLNKVHFRFFLKPFGGATSFLALNSAFWFGLIFFLFIKIAHLRREKETEAYLRRRQAGTPSE